MTTTRNVDIDKAIEWIDEHWTGQKECPICKNTGWFVGDVIGEIRQMGRDQRFVASSFFPVIVLSCKTCGYSLLFNAAVMDPDQKAP